MSFVHNPVVFLFDKLEQESGIQMVSFTTSETPDVVYHNQPYMQNYQESNQASNNPQIYKYIYDPDLAFDFRFHQRIASISYEDRSAPWVTIMFDVGEIRPQTHVLSHKYTSNITTDEGFFQVKLRKSLVPVKFCFISNDVDYLYNFIENISFFWDRICNFSYKQTLYFTEDYFETYDLVGQAMNIQPVNLEGLDTESRGSLAVCAYNFDMVYWTYYVPKGSQNYGHLLKNIDLRVFTVDDLQNLHIIPQVPQ